LGFADEAERRVEIERLWANSQPKVLDFVEAPQNRAEGLDRYYLQMWTNDLIRYAIERSIASIRDPLLELYDREFDALGHVPEGVVRNPGGGGAGRHAWPSARPADRWFVSNGGENVLTSSQFIWHLASVSRALIEAKQSDEPSVRRFLDRALAVVAAHLKRWVLSDQEHMFGTAFFGCDEGVYNHRDFLARKRQHAFRGNVSCNAITDIDTWVIAGAAELIAVHRVSPEITPLDAGTAEALSTYVREAATLLSERTKPQILHKADGTQIEGLVFDPGAYDTYSEQRFAGYEGADFPTSDKARSSGSGWDVSHGGRQVSVFLSLYETRGATGATWPDAKVITGFARSFAFAVFEGDTNRPRLRNFLDGSNGWYRVDLDKHSGYPPFGLTYALLFMPWGRYAAFEPAIGPIIAAAWRIIASDDTGDVAFRNRMFETPQEIGGSGKPVMSVRGGSQWLFPLLASYPLDVTLPLEPDSK
jgi:hypothetical protein